MQMSSLKHSIRDTLVFLFSVSGIARWYRYQKRRQGTLTRIVVFHDVPDMVWFESMIQTLVKQFHIITPEEFQMGKQSPTMINVLITFDDGYASWQNVAIPILEKYHLKALFFVNSGLVERAHNETDSATFMRDALRITPRPALTLQGLHVLKDAGHTIGGHSRNHADLTKLSPQELCSEIEEDKCALEKILGVSVTEFAYPFGMSYHVNESVISAVQFAGYTSAYTAISRFAQGSQTFCTPRMCIEDNLTPRMLTIWINGAYDVFAYIKERCL